jgi:hypothetical protein
MSLLSQLHLLPRPFWVLVGATFVNRFGVFVVPFLALFITRNGNTAAQAGLAVAAYSLGGFGAAWIASLAPEDMRGRYCGFLSFARCAGNRLAPRLACRSMILSFGAVDAERCFGHPGSSAHFIHPQDYLIGFLTGGVGEV